MSLDANLADLRRHADDFTELDQPLADAVAAWIDADWPWERVDRCGR